MDVEEFAGFLRTIFKHQIPTTIGLSKFCSIWLWTTFMFDDSLYQTQVVQIVVVQILSKFISPNNLRISLANDLRNQIPERTQTTSGFQQANQSKQSKTFITTKSWNACLGARRCHCQTHACLCVSGLHLASVDWMWMRWVSANSCSCCLLQTWMLLDFWETNFNVHALYVVYLRHELAFTWTRIHKWTCIHKCGQTFNVVYAFTNAVRCLMWYMHSHMNLHLHQTWTSDMNLHSQMWWLAVILYIRHEPAFTMCMHACVEQCRFMYAACMDTYECMHACTTMSECTPMSEVDIAHACTLMHSDPMN